MERELITEDRINRIFSKELTPGEISELWKKIAAHPDAKFMVYYHRTGKAKKIPMMIRPRIITPYQLRYYHEVGIEIVRAFKKILPLYFHVKELKELFPFSQDEKEWLEDICKHPSFARSIEREDNNIPVVARLDSNASFRNPIPRASFKLFEINGAAIGAVYFEAVIEKIISDIITPVIVRHDHALTPVTTTDVRRLLLNDIVSHAKILGYTNPNIGFLEEKKDPYGTHEYSYFVPYYKKMGYNAFHIDPRELYLKNDRIYYKGLSMDVIYRDCEITDLVRLQKKFKKVSVLKKAFSKNQMISSIAGEFDHKGAFELFSNAKFYRYFSQRQREFFKRHILWTRVIRELRTTDPGGKEVNLIEYILKHKDDLLIKPNRGLGGSGIKLGPLTTGNEWKESVEDALRVTSSQVVQSLSTVVTERFPVLDRDRHLRFEDFYTDAGFVITKGGLGILSRASKNKIVNIAKGGGMCAVLVMEYRK
ncbi:MAG: hypothetical protein HYY56_05340 [Candidatus Omnitrophica bacterium]|nr:hypothetical protein [Candidatus Omnitrophota bacterium]